MRDGNVAVRMRTASTLAVAIALIAVLVHLSTEMRRTAPSVRDSDSRAAQLPHSVARSDEGPEAHSATEPMDPEIIALAGLQPEDVEWVLDRVERTQSVRTLTDAERLQLMSELASIRMFTVLERTEEMSPREEMP